MKKIITDFHVLAILIPEKYDLSKRKFSVCHAATLAASSNFDKIFFSGSCHTNLRFSKQFSYMQHSTHHIQDIAYNFLHGTSNMQHKT
jgi:hypothetical protein